MPLKIEQNLEDSRKVDIADLGYGDTFVCEDGERGVRLGDGFLTVDEDGNVTAWDIGEAHMCGEVYPDSTFWFSITLENVV